MYEEDLIDLEDGIRRLKVEYDIFFNGHRKKPPEDLRFRVERVIKRLSEVNLTFKERFRYSTLVGRFYVYKDLWRRHQTDRELGDDLPEATSAGHTLVSPARPHRPAEGLSISITDPEKEEEKIRRLYDALLLIRGRNAKTSANIFYPQFVKYITSQAQGIRGKYGCSSVVFTLTVEENAIKFVARAGTDA